MIANFWSHDMRGSFVRASIASLVMFGFGSACAQGRVEPTVLKLAIVSLDARQWALDEEKADPDGDRFFYADHQGVAGEISIHVSELKSGDLGQPLDLAARDFLKGIKQKSKHFVERPCPENFTPQSGWFCAAYESTILTPVPDTLTVMHITRKDGYTIYKKAKYPITAGFAERAFAAEALHSIVLKP
jgi:hypothetical protein